MNPTEFIRQAYASNITAERRASLKSMFTKADVDNSGYISICEVQNLLSTESFRFPLQSARMLVRIYSSQGQISFDDFMQIEGFASYAIGVFHGEKGDRKAIQRSEVADALMQMRLNFTSETLEMLFKHFDTNDSGSLSLPQWIRLTSLCLLGRRLFTEWDVQVKGELTIGLEQVLLIGTWFTE